MSQTRNSKLILSATVLAFISFLVHTIVGTYETQGPLFASNLPQATKVIFYVCWHIVTITLLASTWVLFHLHKAENTEAVRMVLCTLGVSWIVFGLLFPCIAWWVGGLGFIVQFPQVVLLVPVGILSFMGGIQSKF
jgi:hypothetical protein